MSAEVTEERDLKDILGSGRFCGKGGWIKEKISASILVWEKEVTRMYWTEEDMQGVHAYA